ncbi:hypothetical protein CDIK_1017 [Cucumispora dikerogammari]|nr:hypothetical protein CDIK_1017 [Cucumispora dikerogammari]
MLFLLTMLKTYLTQATNTATQVPLSNPTAQDAGNMSIARMTNSALQKVIQPTIHDPKVKEMLSHGISPECINRVQETNMQQLRQVEVQKCMQEKKQKTQKIVEALEKRSSASNKCIQKLSVNAMECDIYTSVDSLLKEPYYKMSVFGNMYIIEADEKPISLALFEHIKYDIEVEKKDESSLIDTPDAEYIFNKPGILIANHGSVSIDEQQDKCKDCFDQLEQTLVDGGNVCGGCDVEGNVYKSLKGNYNYHVKSSNGDDIKSSK